MTIRCADAGACCPVDDFNEISACEQAAASGMDNVLLIRQCDLLTYTTDGGDPINSVNMIQLRSPVPPELFVKGRIFPLYNDGESSFLSTDSTDRDPATGGFSWVLSGSLVIGYSDENMEALRKWMNQKLVMIWKATQDDYYHVYGHKPGSKLRLTSVKQGRAVGVNNPNIITAAFNQSGRFIPDRFWAGNLADPAIVRETATIALYKTLAGCPPL